MKYFYFSIKISFLIFLINKKIEFTEKRYQNLEAVAQRCSVKKGVLEILKNSQENTSARASFFIKFIKKRDSGKGVFL